MNEAYLVWEVSKGWAQFLECIYRQRRSVHILLPSNEAAEVLKNRLQNYPEFENQIYYYTPLGLLEFYLKKCNKQKQLLPPLVARTLLYEEKLLAHFFEPISDDEVFELYSRHVESQQNQCAQHQEKYFSPHEALKLLNAEIGLNLFEFGIAYGFTASHEKDDYLKAFSKISKISYLFAFAPTPKVWVKQFSDSVQSVGRTNQGGRDLTVWVAKNPVQESQFVANTYTTAEEAILVFPPASPECKSCLNQFLPNKSIEPPKNLKNIFESLNTWIDWQQNNSFEAFNSWLQTQRNCPTKTKEALKRVFAQAFDTCLTDNFSVLHRFASEKLIFYEKSLHTLVEWPDKAEWDVLVNLTINNLPKTLSPYAKSLFEDHNLNGLAVEKKTFFTAFQWALRLKIFGEDASNEINLETASIFSWKTIFIPFLNQKFWASIGKDKKRFYRRCFRFLGTSKANLCLSFSQNDIEGNKLAECSWLKDWPEPFVHFKDIRTIKTSLGRRPFQNLQAISAEKNNSRFSKATYLHNLPKTATFPCKVWERFIQYPERAWLEDVLKFRADASSSEPFDVRSRIIGEWVHDNLSFIALPKTKEDWVRSVREKALKLRARVSSAYDKIPYYWLQTWEHALSIAECIANTHGGFNNSLQHYSEKSLPKTIITLPHSEENVTTYGRIDWLISSIKAEEIRAGKPVAAEVIDFKTSEKFFFTLSQLAKGVGLQLVLYGLILEKLGYCDILLSVISPNGKKSSHPLSIVKEELSNVWGKLAEISKKNALGSSPQLNYNEANSLPIATLTARFQ